MIIEELIYLARIVGAALLGFIIGFERKMRLKEAGIRTHAIVAVGACLIMVVSKYGFADVPGGDPTRIAAQIVSGIGFLGAGMIIYKREALRGLTTAAGIWATAGVGMCVGAGLYVVSVGTTLIIVLVQFLLHLQLKAFANREYLLINVSFAAGEESVQRVKELFGTEKFIRFRTSRGQGGAVCTAVIRTSGVFDEETIAAILAENEFITSLERVMEE